MTELTLISSHQRQLKLLVEAALHNELCLLEAGIRRTEQRLQEFEAQYDLSSTEFIRRYEQDELEETLEFAEWIVETWRQAHPEVSGAAMTLDEAADMGRRCWSAAREK